LSFITILIISTTGCKLLMKKLYVSFTQVILLRVGNFFPLALYEKLVGLFI